MPEKPRSDDNQRMRPRDVHILNNLRDAFAGLSIACGDKVKRFPGVTCVRHPTRASNFNMAFLRDKESIDHNELRDIQNFYRENNAEWCFVVPPNLTAAFGEVLRRIRISQRRAIPQMVLEEDEAGEVEIPSPPPGFKILPVRTVREMRTWAQVAREGFGMGRQNAFRLLLNATSLESYNITSFIGSASNKPVATSCCLVSEGVTGIFGVSTVPRARGHGYGEAMTWETVRCGRSRGSHLFSLQASPMGYPIYHRMGFRRVFDIEEWTVPKDAPDVK